MKKVYITGSSSGIGKALAEAFLQEGHQVVGISRSCSIQDPNYTHHSIDLSKQAEIKQFHFDLKGDFEAFILINNAGTLGDVKHIGELNEESVIDTLMINSIAPFVFINKFESEVCNDQSDKYVLNIGSGAGSNAVDGWGLYCSTKASLQMFSEVFFEEDKIRKKQSKMVTLAPGIVDTKMQNEIRSNQEMNFSQVERFTNYKKNDELAKPTTVAQSILANFEKIFAKNEPLQSIRDY